MATRKRSWLKLCRSQDSAIFSFSSRVEFLVEAMTEEGQMMRTALNLLQIAGAFTPFRWAHRRQALILNYHRIGAGAGGTGISARAFAEQVEYLGAHYTITPLPRLAESLLDGRDIPSRLAAITIDDGYRDAYEIAYPILRKHRAPATLFVVTEFVEGNRWLWTDKARYLTALAGARMFEFAVEGGTFSRLRLELSDETTRQAAAGRINATLKTLSETAREATLDRLATELGVPLPERPPEVYGAINWRQAREMSDGGVEIGSHTLTHPILTSLSDDRLRDEVSQSRMRLQAEIGRKVGTFCYPNGNYDLRAQREVARAGYQCAVTTDIGFNSAREHPLALRRIHGEYDLPRFVRSVGGIDQLINRLRDRRPRLDSGQ
jgi:peptidoglycan/xylan/chitin deacetylase (PgdA/CDA1 family)